MKIWILKCDVNNFGNLVLKDKKDLDVIFLFNGQTLKNNWEPLKLKKIDNNKLGNFIGFFPNIPIFDEQALSVTKNLIDRNIEILEVYCSDLKLYAINVINVLDCIDYDKSDYIKFKTSNRIMKFNKYYFKNENKLKEQHIFKIIDEPEGRPFVSEQFKKTIEENNLEGFVFELAWDSEELSENSNIIEKSITQKEINHKTDMEIGDVEKAELKEIDMMINEALNIINCDRDEKPDEIIKVLYEFIENNMSSKYILEFACLFGYCLEIKYKFEWKKVKYINKNSSICLVSKNKKNICPVIFVLVNILENKNTNNLLLLYNMIGNLDKDKLNNQYNILV